MIVFLIYELIFTFIFLVEKKVSPATPPQTSLEMTSIPELIQDISTTLSPISESEVQKTVPPLTESENSNEIEALLSDVLNQMTDHPATVLPVKGQIIESNNDRFSNFAQINAAMLVQELNSFKESEMNKDEKPSNSNVVTEKLIDSDETQTMKDVVEFNDSLASFEQQHIATTNPPLQQTTFNNDMLDTVIVATDKIYDNQILENLPHSSNLNESNYEEEIQNYEQNVTKNYDRKDVEINTATIPTDQQTTTQIFDDNNVSDQTTLYSQFLDKLEENNLLYPTNNSEDSNENEFLSLDKLISMTDISEFSPLTTKIYDMLLEKENVSSQSQLTDNKNMKNISDTEHLYVKLGESTENIEKSTDTSVDTVRIQNEFSKHENDSLDYQTTMSDSNNYYEYNFINNETQMQFPQTTISPEIQSFSTLKPVQYHKQPNLQEHDLMLLIKHPTNHLPILQHVKVNQGDQELNAPSKHEGTEELTDSTNNLSEDVKEFVQLCNELGFNYWKSITEEGILPSRSLIFSPFALTSVLSMVFLGARGSTSGEMNEILKLDDMVTFNPHLILKNITNSVEKSKDLQIIAAAFVREIFMDKSNGRILQFFKEKVQQFYSGYIQEVDFNISNDFIRRKTNMLMKKRTMGKVTEYIKANNIFVNPPLALISANLFEVKSIYKNLLNVI